MNSPETNPEAIDPTKLLPSTVELIHAAESFPLGPGAPNRNAFETLQQIGVDTFAAAPVVDREMAACCISGLWLLHNYLDESHTFSQDIPSAEGSYWHGIMHRREPDFSNAKYWFRRVGNHPVFEMLPAQAAGLDEVAEVEDARLESLSDHWDAMLFVDLCEEGYREGDSSPLARACRRLADAEWKLLFQYCLTRAT